MSQHSASLSLKPPAGIQKVYLDSIDLTLVISAIHEDEASKEEVDLDSSFSNSFGPNMLLDEDKSDTCLFEDAVDDNGAASGLDIDRCHELSIPKAHFSNYPETTLADLEMPTQASTILSDHSQKAFSGLSDCARSPVLGTSAKKDCANSTIPSSRNDWLNHCSGLVDAALRKTVVGDGACLARGIRALNKSKTSTLAAIAPALFNEAYQEVSTRHPAQNIDSGAMASNRSF